MVSGVWGGCGTHKWAGPRCWLWEMSLKTPVVLLS